MKALIFSKTTRILHFLFAFFILVAYITKEFPSLLWLHSTLGISVILIVILRILWFFIGENGAKLSSFDLSFVSLKSYITEYFYFSHQKIRNPAASFAAFAMWILAILVGISGLVFIGAKYGSGLFGSLFFDNLDIHLLKEIHELFGNLLIITAAIHIAGVMADNFLKKTEIAKTMFDGELQTHLEIKPLSGVKNSTVLASIPFAIILSSVVYLSVIQNNPLFSSQKIHTNYKILAPIMNKECTECHIFYPPNLTSLTSQMNILNDLSNHFKTNASLDDETLKQIIEETKKLAPQTSRFRFEDLANNESITSTKRWKHEHEEFKDDWFSEHKIKKTDCKACHTNFEEGSITPFELKLNKL